MKTRFFLLLAAMLLGSASAFAQSGNIEPARGDVNGDGTVDVADINAIIAIMKDGGGAVTVGGYFYLGTTEPTADNYKTLPGVVSTYTSIDDAIGTSVSVAAGETLYMLCPAAWVEGKTPELEDKSENKFSFLDEKDITTISGYVIYKTQAWNAPNDVVLKTLGPKTLTITKGSSPSSISDGSTGNVTFATNASATITLTTTSGTGWKAELTSSAGTSHTVKVTNTTGGSAGSIAADAIKVTAVATDTAKYTNITTATGVNTQITLSAPATTYYWYVGSTQPTALPTNDSQLATGNNAGWRKIGTTKPSAGTVIFDGTTQDEITIASSKVTQYFAINSTVTIGSYDATGADQTSSALTGPVVSNGMNIYTTVGQSKTFGQIIKVK